MFRKVFERLFPEKTATKVESFKEPRLEDIAINEPGPESMLPDNSIPQAYEKIADTYFHPEIVLGNCAGTSLYMVLLQDREDFNPFNDDQQIRTTIALQGALRRGACGQDGMLKPRECAREFLDKKGIEVDVVRAEDLDGIKKELSSMQAKTRIDGKTRSATIGVDKEKNGERVPGHAVNVTVKRKHKDGLLQRDYISCIGVDVLKGGVSRGNDEEGCQQVNNNTLDFYKYGNYTKAEIDITTFKNKGFS